MSSFVTSFGAVLRNARCPLRVAAVVIVALGLLACPLLAGESWGSPLQSTALWTTNDSDATTISEQAARARVRTVFIKAADGAAFDAQFTPELIRELRANGISVCAWTFDYGASPLLEAEAAIAAVRTGARCLVVDAEGQYDTRYRAAQLFVHILRRHLGRAFPIGLAGQAETTQHPTFPYSVFLAPGAFQFNLPQIYWRDLRLTVSAAYAATIAENTIYGRPILPVGQLYGEPSPGEVAEFAKVAANYGLTGVSFFSLEAAQPALLDALAVRPKLSHRRTKFATLSAGADGDQVLWLQELLDGAGARLPAGGFFGSQTARAVARFQHQHHLTPTGALDAATWTALLRVRPRTPSWAKRPPLSAR